MRSHFSTVWISHIYKGNRPIFWAAWIPSLIGDARVIHSRSDAVDAVNAVFAMAAFAAPVTMNEKLLDPIIRAVRNRQPHTNDSGQSDPGRNREDL